MGDRSFKLTVIAQIWSRSLDEFIGGERGRIYLVVNDIGSLLAGDRPSFMKLYVSGAFLLGFLTLGAALALQQLPHYGGEQLIGMAGGRGNTCC